VSGHRVKGSSLPLERIAFGIAIPGAFFEAASRRLRIHGEGGRRTVIASDSDAIQTKLQPQSPSLDRFALLAMTTEIVRLECNAL
jgi:hypothetical protein